MTSRNFLHLSINIFMDRKKVTELKLESLVLYLKTSLGGLFGLLLKTILILLFFYFLQRKQFVCFEPYFSFIECAAQKGHRGKFLEMPSYAGIITVFGGLNFWGMKIFPVPTPVSNPNMKYMMNLNILF